ncbi:MAG: ferritin-like domain-containing protein [Chitinivibrionales bacterium]|nr:ferritin-like domain-containing protein [Chitinivibrionales bacterium]MBD3395293.1 ferritin-like domain-containing protein [Chitinivibrionales bacterium]
MSEDRNALIGDLNKDLELEYAAAIQYVQHQAVMTGGQFESIRKELLIHSQEEMNHAVMLSEQIDFLGGTPTVEVEDRAVSDKTLEMLNQDLEGEENAIARYKARIAQAEGMQEYGLRRVLEDILIQEEEHKRDLLTSINESK